jgi:hypothetical protein
MPGDQQREKEREIDVAEIPILTPAISVSGSACAIHDPTSWAMGRRG